MPLALAPDAFDAVLGDVRRAVDELASTRSRACTDVETLLDGWTGRASAAFADGWAEWRLAAADALAALDSLTAAMTVARGSLLTADDGVRSLLDVLVSRLG